MSESKRRLDEWFVLSLEEHRQAMYRTAMAMLRRSAEAEDAVSTATVNTYARLAFLRSRDSIRPYLLKATVNACRSQLRRRSREDTPAGPLPEAGERMQTPLWAYLEPLSPKLRLVLQLRYGEDLPLKEVCRILRLPKGTVSARINRGLRALRRQMEDAHED